MPGTWRKAVGRSVALRRPSWSRPITALLAPSFAVCSNCVIGEAVITMRVSGVALLEVLRVSAAAKRDTAKRAVEHLAMIALRV